MAWVIILILILGIIFVLYLSNRFEKETSKSSHNDKEKMEPMNKTLEEKIKDISYFNQPYTDKQKNKIRDAIKHKITNAVLDPKDITSFEQVLEPDESDNYEVSDNKGCNEDSFVINIEAGQLEKELINTVRRFSKKSDNSKRDK